MADDDECEPPVKKIKTNPKHISNVILTLAECIEALVGEVAEKMNASTNVNSFIVDGLRTLGRAIGLYAKALSDLSTTTFNEFDAVVRDSFKCPEVRESFEELLSAEDHWTSFLNTVEKRKEEVEGSVNEEIVKEGEKLPMDMTFTLVDSKEVVPLSKLMKDASGQDHKYLLLVLLRHLA